MIRYALACDAGHAFDSWFRDSQGFEEQVSAGHVSCPLCRSARVAKRIMAPAVVAARRTSASPVAAEGADAAPPKTTSETTGDVAPVDARGRELRDLVRKVRDKVVAEGHDVGRRFAVEARRIHDGDAPARQIYGQASVAEARDLLEDGIAILPLPIVPDELN